MAERGGGRGESPTHHSGGNFLSGGWPAERGGGEALTHHPPPKNGIQMQGECIVLKQLVSKTKIMIVSL